MHTPSVTRHQSRAWPFACLAFVRRTTEKRETARSLKPLSSWCQDNGSVNTFYSNWNTGCFMMWEMKGMKIIQTKGKLKPTHGLVCTSRMRKTISPGQWQQWTAVSPLLGPKVCLIQLVRTRHRPKTSANPFEYFKRYITHTDCQLSFNGHLKRLTHPLQGQLEGLSMDFPLQGIQNCPVKHCPP